ncbi:hypothetical protein Hanom_Chr07g00655951 [Helianthus anomalus]
MEALYVLCFILLLFPYKGYSNFEHFTFHNEIGDRYFWFFELANNWDKVTIVEDPNPRLRLIYQLFLHQIPVSTLLNNIIYCKTTRAPIYL